MDLKGSISTLKHKLISKSQDIDRAITEKTEPKEIVTATSKSRIHIPDEKGHIVIGGQGYSTRYTLKERITKETGRTTPEKEAAYASPVPIASKYALKRAAGGLYQTAKETGHIIKKVTTPQKYTPSTKEPVKITEYPQLFRKTYVEPARQIPGIISTAVSESKKAFKEDPVRTTAELVGSLAFFEGAGRAARASKLFRPRKKVVGIASKTALKDTAIQSGKTTILKGTGKYDVFVERAPMRSLWKPSITERPVRVIDKIPAKVSATTAITESGFESYIKTTVAKKDTFHVLKGKPRIHGKPDITTLEVSQLHGGGTFTYGTVGIHTDLRLFPAYQKAGVIVPLQAGTKQKLQSIFRFQEKKFNLFDASDIHLAAYAGASHTSYSFPPFYTFHTKRYYEGMKITGELSKKPFVVGLETGDSFTKGIFSKHKIPTERVGLFESEYPLLEYKPSTLTKSKPSKPIYTKQEIQKMQAPYQEPTKSHTNLRHKPLASLRLSMDDMKIISSDARAIAAVETTEQYITYPAAAGITKAPVAAIITQTTPKMKTHHETIPVQEYIHIQKDTQAQKIISKSVTMQATKPSLATDIKPVQKITPYEITTLISRPGQITLPIRQITLLIQKPLQTSEIQAKEKLGYIRVKHGFVQQPPPPPTERHIRIPPPPHMRSTATPQKPTLKARAISKFKVSFLTDKGSFKSKYPAFESKTEAKQFAGLVSLRSRKITGFELKEKKTGKERLKKRLPSWLKLAPKFRESGTRYTERKRPRLSI